MTVREIINYVQGHINSRRYWNDNRLIELINIVQLKMANDLKMTFTDFYKFSSTSEQRYLMPSNLISIEYIWYNDNGTEGEIKLVASPRELYGKHSDPEGTYSSPYKAFLWNTSGRNELWIYPIFSNEGVDIYLWFYGLPPRVNGENDVPAIPVEWHIHLVEAIINRTLLIDQQITKADELVMWQNIIRSCRAIETVKTATEQRAEIQPYSFRTSSLLLDGSEKGIKWE